MAFSLRAGNIVCRLPFRFDALPLHSASDRKPAHPLPDLPPAARLPPLFESCIMIRAALALCLMATPALAGVSTKCLPASVKAKLAHIERHYGKVTVISAYRKNARIAGSGKRSKHAQCLAADFHITKNKAAAVRWLRSQPGELITYGCSMHHVHAGLGSYKGHHCVNSKGIRR